MTFLVQRKKPKKDYFKRLLYYFPFSIFPSLTRDHWQFNFLIEVKLPGKSEVKTSSVQKLKSKLHFYAIYPTKFLRHVCLIILYIFDHNNDESHPIIIFHVKIILTGQNTYSLQTHIHFLKSSILNYAETTIFLTYH